MYSSMMVVVWRERERGGGGGGGEGAVLLSSIKTIAHTEDLELQVCSNFIQRFAPTTVYILIQYSIQLCICYTLEKNITACT